MDELPAVRVEIVRMTPAVAEVILRADVAGELRGRLMGPRCSQTTTVEIAYSLKPIPSNEHQCAARAIIPEPSFWEPAFPYFYSGPVELWRNGEKVGEQWVEVGLRKTRE
jgi:hypothetical protein